MAALFKPVHLSETPSGDARTDREHETSHLGSRVRVLNEQRQAVLAKIDEANFSWFHVKIALVAGAGFFADGYDIYSINMITTMLGYLYGSAQDPSDPSIAGRSLGTGQSFGVKVATPAGTLIGQLLFGWLADVLGRKRIYGLELIIMILATFGQTICAGGQAVNIISLLIVWRLIMGIGVGGDYPLSSVISAEFSSTRIRGRLMAVVFSNYGWGQLGATIASTVVVSAYKSSILHDEAALLRDLDQIWRLIVGFGCIPAAVAIYFRFTIPETPRFTMDIESNVVQAAKDVDNYLSSDMHSVDPEAPVARVHAPKASRRDFRAYFSQWKNLKVLIGTSWSWFVLDVAVYGLNLNSSILLEAIHFGPASKGLTSTAAVIYQTMHNVCIGNLILSIASFIPGYCTCFLLIDRWGRIPLQLTGFIANTVLLVAMGSAYGKLTQTGTGQSAFVALYVLSTFFQSVGPNTTTFVLPGEAFPTRYRSTAHGISAASGKLGAVLAQVAFQFLKDIGGENHWIGHIMQIFGAFMITGVASTLLIPETKQKTLEDLSNEDQHEFLQTVSTASSNDEDSECKAASIEMAPLTSQYR
ncbi:phosphate transporter [Obba rivulosa]|uniref:Phosphate transporter n=1 Tax=Obba rivulosa TaxID=1052685 RepID=A0A8E2DNI1_9APHY|nr:phosphate transporter [Obba rivulosa]